MTSDTSYSRMAYSKFFSQNNLMNYYKAILQYDGSDHIGFQYQEGMPTIQGDLNLSLQKILTGKVTTRAASRTDKGVHAVGQVIKISAEDPTPLNAAQLNEVLPSHMRCLDLSPCPGDFIPSVDQTSKEYRYLFTNTPGTSGQTQRYIAQTPYTLNFDHIHACVAMLKGRNDFKNFWSIGGLSNTTIREILECDLTLIEPDELFKGTLFTAGDVTSCWQFRIVGKGFLKHMVRHLVGALWMVGNGRLTVKDFSLLLYGEQKEQRPWKKADPRGLYLLKVNYEPDTL
jgi:tRNA pseudouridine38-40 synthase